MPWRCGFAHNNSSSESAFGRLSGEICAICSHVYMLCSQRGVSFRRIRLIGVYGCEDVEQSSSSVVIGIAAVNVVDMGLPDHISGPLNGCRSAAISVAILRAIVEGQRGLSPW